MRERFVRERFVHERFVHECFVHERFVHEHIEALGWDARIEIIAGRRRMMGMLGLRWTVARWGLWDMIRIERCF